MIGVETIQQADRVAPPNAKRTLVTGTSGQPARD
jgi:hypothetical protein